MGFWLELKRKLGIRETLDKTLFLAMEFGFDEHEKGNNIEKARGNLVKLLRGENGRKKDS